MSRTKKLATVIGAIFVIVLFVAPIAAAHHPAITVTMDCSGKVTYTVTAWDTNQASARTFTGVKVYSGSTLIGTGDFNSADNYSFTGSFTVDSSVNSVTLTAKTDGTWGDGYTGVDQTSDTATRPENCATSPTIATVLSSSAVTTGATVHDTSSLSGASTNPKPTGTVKYTVFTNSNCSTGAIDAGTKTLSNGNIPNSNDITFNTPGTYYWQAVYSGDSNNNAATSPCTSEQLVVTKGTPSISTVISPAGPIAIGAQAHDTSSLAGASNPTGTVSYKLYSDNQCESQVADLTPASNTVSSSTLPDSKPYTFNTAGTFYFVATYSGDGNNAWVSSGCAAEPIIVGKASPTIATAVVPSFPINLGGSANDTSSLTGASSPTGTVSYALYSANNCTGFVADLTPASNAVTASTLPASKSYTFNTAGTFYFVATYSGDANNGGPISSGCSDEPIVVNQAQTATTTAIKQGGSTVTSIANGTSVTDVATVSGQVGNIAPTGTVSFLFYSKIDCSGSSTSAGSPALANGSATSTSQGPLSTGSYSFKATYNGDANYLSSTGACEPLTVNAPPPPTPTPDTSAPAISITKNPKSQTIASGGTANFTITVKNTGNVTLTNVTVTDAQAPGCNAALGTMAPGASTTYNCSLANVTSGFTNSAGATGTPPSGPNVTATDTAPVTVTPPPAPVAHPAITIKKDPNSQTIGVGGTASFTITVTNTGDVTLTDVTVSDPSSPNCDRNLGTLTAGQSKNYTCTRKNVNANFENVANVTGKPPTGAPVTATDNANVKVKAFVPPQNPRIAIVKSPKSQTLTTHLTTSKNANGSTKSTVRYSTATFTIKVTNTGNVALHDVKVSDPLSPACDHAVGSLPTGASKTYTCTRPAVSSNFTNFATVTGLSPKGTKVTDTDHAKVIVKVKTTNVGGATATKPAKSSPGTTATGSPKFTG